MLRLLDRFDEDRIREVFQSIDESYPNDGYSPSDLRKTMMKYPTWFIDDDDDCGMKACLISEVLKGQPYVWSVSTRPAYRGRGCAKTLLKEFEKHYVEAGYQKMWLQVRTENPAQKLYFDMGYRVSSFDANLYGALQHGMSMRKII